MGLLLVAVVLVLLGLTARRAQARDPFWRGRLRFGKGGIWPANDEFSTDRPLRLRQAQQGTNYLFGRFLLLMGTVLLVIALLNLG